LKKKKEKRNENETERNKNQRGFFAAINYKKAGGRLREAISLRLDGNEMRNDDDETIVVGGGGWRFFFFCVCV
jgi:hypothetical protein